MHDLEHCLWLLTGAIRSGIVPAEELAKMAWEAAGVSSLYVPEDTSIWAIPPPPDAPPPGAELNARWKRRYLRLLHLVNR